jgi:hypothetical protein
MILTKLPRKASRLVVSNGEFAAEPDPKSAFARDGQHFPYGLLSSREARKAEIY